MKLTNKIQKELMRWARGNMDIIIPNFYYGRTECDLFKITGSELLVEYEIKISRSDFFADFKKQDGNKHQSLQNGGSYGPNRFFYVMPKGLIEVGECPKYAGLLFYNEFESFDMVKNAPLLHKRKFESYRKVCQTLSFRDSELRAKLNRIRNGSLENELSRVKKELEYETKLRQEYSNEIFLLKHSRKNAI